MKKVNSDEYKKVCDIYMRKYCRYLDELAKINKAENKECEKLIEGEGDHHAKWDKFEERYPEKVAARQKERETLKEKYGKYSSYYNCPVYFLATSVAKIEEIIKPGEANHDSCVNNLKKWKGKKVQSDYDKSVYGYCIGLGFTIDEIYYVIKDEQTGREGFELSISPYDKRDHQPKRSYYIVTNGKDYL